MTHTRNNEFYRDHYQTLIIFLIGVMLLMLALGGVVLYQVSHRPLPQFIATMTNEQANEQTMALRAYDEPNLLPSTLLKWASKAAATAYTFNFVNYNEQIAAVRPYFTETGWADYKNSVAALIKTITQNKLYVNGVVSGPPVISNQGDLTGHGYMWRIQIPFLVTYQSTEAASKQGFFVTLTIVRVPTIQNPRAIGIDQFVMT